jgi:NTE family protein
MRINKNLKWALVLSGGGAKGFAHVGVLKSLAERGYPDPSLVVGTSMGAIVGGLYASGMAVEELSRFALDEFDITQYLDSYVFKITGPVVRLFQAGQLLGLLTGKPGIDSGNQVLALIERLSGHKRFEEARIPFRCNAVDLISGREVVFQSGSMARAIRASMSFPVFFDPLMEGDMCLADGGIADNMPIRIAAEAGFRRILAIDVGGFKPKPSSDFDSAGKIVFRSLEVALNLMHRQAGKNHEALVISATDNKSTALSFFKKKELIALGKQVIQENEKDLDAFFGSGIRAALARRSYRNRG